VEHWKNITFLIIETIHNTNSNDEAITLASTICPDPSIRRVESSVNSPQWKMISMVTITCPIDAMSTPLKIVKTPLAAQ
jgi:hypothetical protein